MGLADLIREGAMDLLGVGDEVEALRESNAAATMMARKLEDLQWGDLLRVGEASAYFEPNRQQQHEQTTRAYRYFFNDPIVKRTLMLRALYTFGRGMTPPKYRPDPDRHPGEADAGTKYINRFWKDPENQQAFTGAQAMFQKDLESALQGNVFLLMFRGGETAPAAANSDLVDAEGPATLKLTDLPEREIVDIIPHPANRKLPVYYKRQYRSRKYDFNAQQGEGLWTSGDITTVYYRDWRNEAPDVWGIDEHGEPCSPDHPLCKKVEPWGPPANLIREGRIYHIYENKTSDMRFGINDAQAYMKWAKGLNEYMTQRMATVQAIAQIALRAKTKGGPKSVSQVASTLQDLTRLAGVVEGSDSLSRLPASTGRTQASVESNNVDLQPMVQDTNAQGAQGDIQTMKGQIAAGSGIPVHHLGDVGSANLATATSMDGPLLRMIQWNQERWETVNRDLCGYMLEGVGLDPARLEIDMPPILERDVANLVNYFASAAGVVDPNGASKELHRLMLHEMLDAMGKQNSEELVDQVLPKDSATPLEQNIELAKAANAEPGADTSAAAVSGADDQTTDVQRSAAATRQTTAQAERDANQGRHRGPNEPGGPLAAGRSARDRAATRWGQAQESLFDAEALVEAGQDAEELFDALMTDQFPEELLEAADAALAAFDGDLSLVE